MKAVGFSVAILFGLVLLGLALPGIVPACHCGLDSGCQGCGGVIGNSLGHVSLLCFAYGAMGAVLAFWFGIPLLLLGLVVFGIYKLFTKGHESEN